MIVTLVPINCRPAKLVQNSGNNCEKLAKCMSDHVQLTLTNVLYLLEHATTESNTYEQCIF